MSKELEALESIKRTIQQLDYGFISKEDCEDFQIIETALKDYEELLKIDCKQNTINDFYPNTKSMIDDLLNLVCVKICDFLKEGETYTKTRMLEILGTAVRYVKTFAYGKEFNETEKVGVNEKKLKALEIIKEKEVNIHNFKEFIIKQNWTYEQYLDEEKDPNTSGHQLAYKLLTQKEFDLLKEVLL